MSRAQIHPCVLLVLAAPASALQQDASSSLRPISGPVRSAGTLHLADGSWTRHSDSAALGNDVLYDNTCSPQFYYSLDGDTVIDEGRVPGTSSPNDIDSKTGCATSYSIDGFQIAYCTDQAVPSFDYSFYSNYAQCTSGIGVTPTASFALTGLPGAPGALTFCWTVNVDVSGTPFVLDASETNPRFGFAMSSSQASFSHGPVVAGNPMSCTWWDGSSFDPVLNLAESGTGMGTVDAFFLESGPTLPGCWWFGSTPFGSFWLELYGATCATDGAGQAAFCVAGVSPTALCPCGNDPIVGLNGGCLNSMGTAGRLVGVGNPSLANDTVLLVGTQMPPQSSVLYFQGTLRHNLGNGSAFGDGLRCAGGGITRLGTALNGSSGLSQYPSGGQPSVSARGGVTQPGTRTYQAWYRNSASFCTAATFNTSNGWEIFWGA